LGEHGVDADPRWPRAVEQDAGHRGIADAPELAECRGHRVEHAGRNGAGPDQRAQGGQRDLRRHRPQQAAPFDGIPEDPVRQGGDHRLDEGRAQVGQDRHQVRARLAVHHPPVDPDRARDESDGVRQPQPALRLGRLRIAQRGDERFRRGQGLLRGVVPLERGAEGRSHRHRHLPGHRQLEDDPPQDAGIPSGSELREQPGGSDAHARRRAGEVGLLREHARRRPPPQACR
jgi:hypothetical protein